MSYVQYYLLFLWNGTLIGYLRENRLWNGIQSGTQHLTLGLLEITEVNRFTFEFINER